jgi:hypothetical protein
MSSRSKLLHESVQSRRRFTVRSIYWRDNDVQRSRESETSDPPSLAPARSYAACSLRGHASNIHAFDDASVALLGKWEVLQAVHVYQPSWMGTVTLFSHLGWQGNPIELRPKEESGNEAILPPKSYSAGGPDIGVPVQRRPAAVSSLALPTPQTRCLASLGTWLCTQRFEIERAHGRAIDAGVRFPSLCSIVQRRRVLLLLLGHR